jgi:hypothetical protein
MKKFLCFLTNMNLLCLFLFIPSVSAQGDQKMNDPSSFVRAIYGFSSKAGPFQGLSPGQMVEKLRSWGCNAVFLKKEPPEVVQALKAAGIRRYREKALFVGCSFWESHPETRPVEADGTLLEKEEWYCGLSPNHEWLRQRRLEEIREIAAREDIDGIWLDFIRYPVHWEFPEPRMPQTDFSEEVVRQFAADTGIKLTQYTDPKAVADEILQDHSPEWYEWRVNTVTEFVKVAAETAQEENPALEIGLFAIPWFRGEREDAIYQVAGQDFEALAPYVDVFSPMVYHVMLGEEPEWITECSRKMEQATGKPVWPIIQACHHPGHLSSEEFIEAIEAGQASPAGGIIIFGLNHLVNEDRLETLKSVWQGE